MMNEDSKDVLEFFEKRKVIPSPLLHPTSSPHHPPGVSGHEEESKQEGEEEGFTKKKKIEIQIDVNKGRRKCSSKLK